MNDGITFSGIEEVPPTSRRRALERPRAGYDVARRPGRLTFSSEYHRLLERERREPWAAFFWLCFVLACLVGGFYFAASA